MYYLAKQCKLQRVHYYHLLVFRTLQLYLLLSLLHYSLWTFWTYYLNTVSFLSLITNIIYIQASHRIIIAIKRYNSSMVLIKLIAELHIAAFDNQSYKFSIYEFINLTNINAALYWKDHSIWNQPDFRKLDPNGFPWNFARQILPSKNENTKNFIVLYN